VLAPSGGVAFDIDGTDAAAITGDSIPAAGGIATGVILRPRTQRSRVAANVLTAVTIPAPTRPVPA
jgi:hypothetical protein